MEKTFETSNREDGPLERAKHWSEAVEQFMELPEIKETRDAIRLLKDLEEKYKDISFSIAPLKSRRDDLESGLRSKLEEILNSRRPKVGF